MPKFFTDLDARDLLCCCDPATRHVHRCERGHDGRHGESIGAVRIAARDRRVGWPHGRRPRLVLHLAGDDYRLFAKGLGNVVDHVEMLREPRDQQEVRKR